MNDTKPARKIVMHVNFRDDERYGFVLNNIENICDYYLERGQALELRVVCHGPGLHLLRKDTSHVRERLLNISAARSELGFCACSNTLERMTRAEGVQPELVAPVTMVAAGLPEIVELQARGWHYLKP